MDMWDMDFEAVGSHQRVQELFRLYSQLAIVDSTTLQFLFSRTWVQVGFRV